MGRRGLRFLYLLYFLSYDVINDVIMTDADCTPGREPRSVAACRFIIIMPRNETNSTSIFPVYNIITVQN